MTQPDALYPGLQGGCVTKVAGEAAHPLTVSTRTGPCLVITPDGELLMPGITPSEAADLLVDMFARSYGSALLKAEAKALAAETHNRTLERRAKDAEDRIKVLENQVKRGMVDVLQPNPKSTRSRWFAGKREQDASVAAQLDALGPVDKPDREP